MKEDIYYLVEKNVTHGNALIYEISIKDILGYVRIVQTPFDIFERALMCGMLEKVNKRGHTFLNSLNDPNRNQVFLSNGLFEKMTQKELRQWRAKEINVIGPEEV